VLSRLTPIAAVAAALAVAACGGDGGGDADSGPAAAVPADAPLYFDVTVKPEGSAKTDAEAALGKILDSPDPSSKLISLIEQSAKEDQKPGETASFAEDIEPWLGQKLGFFVDSFEADQDPTIVVESTDNAAALDALREDTGVTGDEQEYEGHTYELDSDDGTVFGEVGDFIVSGPEAGFKAAVDASEGDSLADSDEFNDTVGDLPEDRLGTFYAEPKNILAAIPEDDLDAGTRDQVEKAAGDALDQPVAGDVTASADSIQLDLSAGSTGVETPESSLLEGVPSQSWLAIGIGSLGDSIKQGFESIENANIPDFDADTLRSQIQLVTGQDIDEIADSLGSGAIFVEGTAEQNLEGALILQSENPATTQDLLTRFQTALGQGSGGPKVKPLASTTGEVGFQVIDPELTKPVHFVQQGDRIVIGYGAGASTQALQGGQTLASAPAFVAAKEALSDVGIDAFLSFAPVFQLAESEGASADPDFQSAKPYIDGLDYLAVGSGDEGDRAQLRLVIGLK
jgi:hypothetical protein